MTGLWSPFDLGTRKMVDSNGPALVGLIIFALNILFMVSLRQGFVFFLLGIRDEAALIKTLTPSFQLRYIFPKGKTELNKRTEDLCSGKISACSSVSMVFVLLKSDVLVCMNFLDLIEFELFLKLGSDDAKAAAICDA